MAKKAAVKAQANPQASALERFMPLLSGNELARLMAELQQPLEPALRVNPLKAEPGAVQTWAQRYGWELRPVPYCPDGWRVSVSQGPLSQTIEHRLGEYYLQDAASMLPVELFDWEGLEDPLVLDLAASPGGKTTHLVAKTGDRGLVMANDSSADRITALRLVLQNWGGLHTAVTNFHGEKFGRWFPDTFDRVLIDAPCSMQGLRSNEAHPMRMLSGRERSGLAQRQLRLLEAALQAARPGGQVVYSTCTLEPEEDEGVIDALLRAYPGQVRVDNLARRLPIPAPGLVEADGMRYAAEVQHSARLWPHLYSTAGFFAARLTKLAASASDPLPYPGRPISLAGWLPLGRKERVEVCEFYQDAYGVDLNDLAARHGLELWRRNEKLYAFPETFLARFGDLPVQGLGLLLGEDGPDGISLSHEWVARFGQDFQVGRVTLSAEDVPAWLRGEDIPAISTAGLPTGRVAAVFDPQARLLGRGKLQANRLKNLLPRRLF
jgi:16S rRNA (cytosine1407-C5)-methyltransferase